MEKPKRPEVNLYVESTYKGPAKRSGKVMYLLECQKSDGTPFTRSEVIEFEESTENQANLIAITTALKRVNKTCLIRVFTQCDHILNTVQNGWHLAWERNGWTNARGKPVKNTELWREMLEELSKHAYSITGEPHKHRDEMITELGGLNGKEHT